jgi:hypothetical protein
LRGPEFFFFFLSVNLVEMHTRSLQLAASKFHVISGFHSLPGYDMSGTGSENLALPT